MSTRRKFLKNAGLTALSVPYIKYAVKEYSLSDINSSDHDDVFWDNVRKQFPLKEGQTYFNNGTMGPMSGYTLNKVMSDMLYSSVHGAEQDYKGNGPELLNGYFKNEEVRKKIGRIINADYKEISLLQNATFGMNYVGQGLDLKAGDEIINTDQEHGGGFSVWKMLAKRKGCNYKQAKITLPANNPQEIIDSVMAQVTKRTKVIAIPHIISVYGVIMPVKEICIAARKIGIFTVLDGAQTVGQIKVDVKDIGCDAYYSSLHKWMLAPGGNGILYVNKNSVDKLWSTIASYNWDHTDDQGFRLMQNGTSNQSLIVGLEAALDFYNTIGGEKWINRINQLGDRLRTGLKDIPKVTIVSSTHPYMSAGMTTYKVQGMTGPELQKHLWDVAKMQPRSVGYEVMRHCTHIYNNEKEIDRALEIIGSI
ncbi:MAG: aminotransferase class V-fold PLP-dependent enzyme [Saprospiraceae bacterium]